MPRRWICSAPAVRCARPRRRGPRCSERLLQSVCCLPSRAPLSQADDATRAALRLWPPPRSPTLFEPSPRATGARRAASTSAGIYNSRDDPSRAGKEEQNHSNQVVPCRRGASSGLGALSPPSPPPVPCYHPWSLPSLSPPLPLPAQSLPAPTWGSGRSWRPRALDDQGIRPPRTQESRRPGALDD